MRFDDLHVSPDRWDLRQFLVIDGHAKAPPGCDEGLHRSRSILYRPFFDR